MAASQLVRGAGAAAGERQADQFHPVAVVRRGRPAGADRGYGPRTVAVAAAEDRHQQQRGRGGLGQGAEQRRGRDGSVHQQRGPALGPGHLGR
ncbi:hypothetical protein GXW82_09280 [Streptacidiphilus sp. 4-A2]|nr:hypothetical protein [Streptacidiphilus sp. 4-A2]